MERCSGPGPQLHSLHEILHGRTPVNVRRPHRPSHRIVVAVLAGALALAGSAVLAPVASAAENAEWSAVPGNPKGSETNRQFIFLDVRPGDTIEESIDVTNKTEEPKRFTVYGADAFNATNGGAFSLTTVNDAPSDLGSWMSFPTTQITVKPGKTVNVPVDIAVPRTATPGDHIGGIVTLDEEVTPGAEGTVRLNVQNQIGVRVYARVAGPLTPQMSITDYTLETDGNAVPFGNGTSVVSFNVENTGNVRLTPDAEVVLTGAFNRELYRTEPQTLNEVLPGGTVSLRTEIPASVFIGPVSARLDLVAPETSAGADATAWVIPWLALLVLAVLIIGFVLWRLRRRSEKSAADAAPAPADAPVAG
jgi:hypothetical protein